jgi:hypothetical protein
MDGSDDDVVLLRSGQVEWRINGVEHRMGPAQAQALALSALKRLGWETAQQQGLKVGALVQQMEARKLRDELERLRASGKALNAEVVHRPIATGEWGSDETQVPARGKERRFTKDPAEAKTETKAPPARKSTRPVDRIDGDPTINMQLFEDPVAQLKYEVRHAYLMTVPLSQRAEWPAQEYGVLLGFLDDIAAQAGQVSRAQIIEAVVDIICSRINSRHSRKPRPLLKGGGEESRPQVMRPDGALAWRANISTGPAARRIMWWVTPAGRIELARVATHDDFDVPER